jgi:hypothetical protein
VVAIVSVDVPVNPGVRVMLVGANVKVMPVAAGATVAESETLPVSPRLLAVIVEVAEPPAVKLAGDAAPAARVKSAVTTSVMAVELVVEPLAALIVIV